MDIGLKYIYLFPLYLLLRVQQTATGTEERFFLFAVTAGRIGMKLLFRSNVP